MASPIILRRRERGRKERERGRKEERRAEREKEGRRGERGEKSGDGSADDDEADTGERLGLNGTQNSLCRGRECMLSSVLFYRKSLDAMQCAGDFYLGHHDLWGPYHQIEIIRAVICRV